MKFLDRFLRAWRTRIALRASPAAPSAILDIGCGDGFLLQRVAARARDGIDPTITDAQPAIGMRLLRGSFPADIGRLGNAPQYDAIFSLAVFEHLSDAELHAARTVLPELLRGGGRLVITVPHPLVDRILDLLMFLRVIDGQAVHEHHGFDPEHLAALASDRLRLVRRSRFQFGLNNLFVFEKAQ